MADRWLIEYGPDREKLSVVGRATSRATAAGVAQAHFDSLPAEHRGDPIAFDELDPAGDYCGNGGGWYRITRITTGKWRAVP